MSIEKLKDFFTSDLSDETAYEISGFLVLLSRAFYSANRDEIIEYCALRSSKADWVKHTFEDYDDNILEFDDDIDF